MKGLLNRSRVAAAALAISAGLIGAMAAPQSADAQTIVVRTGPYYHHHYHRYYRGGYYYYGHPHYWRHYHRDYYRHGYRY